MMIEVDQECEWVGAPPPIQIISDWRNEAWTGISQKQLWSQDETEVSIKC